MLSTDLLRNYRAAHARVTSIEPFEATLREHTPLTSIADSAALVEFLSQRSLQSEMVLEELKRVSAENKEVVKERDELKVKLSDAEKHAKEAFDEAAGLREQRRETEATAEASGKDDETKTVQDETFFSYEREVQADVQRQEAEDKERREYINELATENATVKIDLETSRMQLSATENKVEAKNLEIVGLQRKLNEVQAELEKDKEQLKQALLDKANQQFDSKTTQESDAASQVVAEKTKQVNQKVINALRDQVKQVQEEKRVAEGKTVELQFEIKRMESEADATGELITRLRGQEAAADSYKKKLLDAEQERDDANRLAESKKGHEAAVADFRGRWKRAEKQRDEAERQRDEAIQSILKCGRCEVPKDTSLEAPAEESISPRSRGDSEATDRAEMSTQPTETSTPAIPIDSLELTAPATAKKNKKKKSKHKKKDAADTSLSAAAEEGDGASAPSNITLEQLMADPEKGREIWRNQHSGDFAVDFVQQTLGRLRAEHEQEVEEHAALLRDREDNIVANTRLLEERNEEIRALHHRIGQQEAAIERLDKKLRGEEDLREEIETLKESMIEAGSESTDAKHELKMLREQKASLQAEIDNLTLEDGHTRRSLRDAEREQAELTVRCKALTAQVDELKSAQSTSSVTEAAQQALQAQLEAVETSKQSLQVAKEACEKQIEDMSTKHAADREALDIKHEKLRSEFDQVTARAKSLETDLAASEQLAQSRFKDLTDLREHFGKVQPELKKLRQEAEELEVARADLEKSHINMKKLETRESDLKSEIAKYKSQVSSKNGEIQTLKDRAKKNDERVSALEDTYERTRKDLEQNERIRDEAAEAHDKVQSQLETAREELQSSKANLGELEKQANQFREDAARARNELQIKTAQQTSAQSLMDSMRDQTRELAVQMKEARERNESLEEELGDAHRLLSERGREGETMRRLIADVEGRADSRVKEMRERLDLAVEERDRAEDESSTIGRRKGREVEDLKSKLKDAERDASRAADARGEAERRERDFHSRQAGLEQRALQTQEELAEARTAMAQLQDTLNESERQLQDLEKNRTELRKTLEERETRLEKLQKSSKSMVEELRTLQTASGKQRQGSNLQSSRSSVDSTRVTSPISRGSNGTLVSTTQGKELDYVYLKNVLLQFLEQKEKKHQMQLVPVLGMLLHFDK